jgi:protein SCO1/2
VKGRVLVWMALLMLTVAPLCGCQSYKFNGTLHDEPAMAPEIELTNVKGGTYRLSESRGRIVLIYFGYTFCPDICPGTLAQAREMFDLLGEQAEMVEFLFVTVDPERDTAEAMSAYVSAFHPRIVGLTGSPDELAQVFESYGIVAEKEPLPESAVGYVMNHTSRVFLVDQDGRLRLSYSFGTVGEDIVEDIRHLLG